MTEPVTESSIVFPDFYLPDKNVAFIITDQRNTCYDRESPNEQYMRVHRILTRELPEGTKIIPMSIYAFYKQESPEGKQELIRSLIEGRPISAQVAVEDIEKFDGEDFKEEGREEDELDDVAVGGVEDELAEEAGSE